MNTLKLTLAVILMFLFVTVIFQWNAQRVHLSSSSQDTNKHLSSSSQDTNKLLSSSSQDNNKHLSSRSQDTNEHLSSSSQDTNKIIFLYNSYFGKRDWFFGLGQEPFVKYGCKINACFISTKLELLPESSLVIFHAVSKFDFPRARPAGQRWVGVRLESPIHSNLGFVDGHTDLSMTYQSDSDIVMTYGHFENKTKTSEPFESFGRGRNGTLWFVSNCRISFRNEIFEELKKFVPVDVIGGCGRSDHCPYHDNNCITKEIRRYKFYLALENSQCKDYITEKFWRTLKSGVLPIVAGANIEDYRRVAPPNSFLHVDNFTSIKELANYMSFLESNTDAYDEYFEWKKLYEADSYALSIPRAACQLCEVAHREVTGPSKTAANFSKWFSGAKQCR